MSRVPRFLIYPALFFLLVSCATPIDAGSPQTVTLRPGLDVQAIVDNAPEGTTFRLEPGVYRMQRVIPKDGQSFIGQPGVIFNGALVLDGWRRDGGYWVAEAPIERLSPAGECADDGTLCALREDLFVDDVLYWRNESLDDLERGQWYDGGDRVYIVDDPSGKTTELSVTPYAFVGDAPNVALRDIVVEKYASAAQEGAIEFLNGENWLLVDVTARWNHGVGARIGPGAQLTGGSYSHNGQLGIGGGYGSGIRIVGVEIAYNNYASFSVGWEAGGTKFVETDGLVVRDSCVHHNFGPGLWTDIDNINVEYANNKVFANAGDGIKHEISYKAVIRDNIAALNGSGYDVWFWGSQILVQNSRDVEVYGNTVQIGAHSGNGISIVQQNRGEGAYGPWISVNNDIRDNTIIYLGRNGRSGMAADYDRESFYRNGVNSFNGNTYVVPDAEHNYIEVDGDLQHWNRVQQLGYETDGELRVERRSRLELTCNE